MKYRTKPFEIEAVLFDGNNFAEVQEFVGSHFVDVKWTVGNFQPAGTFRNWALEPDGEVIFAEVYDVLHSTWVGVRVGDYIIRGSKGEYYPCDPEVFESKYEVING